MLHFRLVSILTLTFHGIVTAEAVRCLECTHVPDPLSCNTITECADSEQCFVEQGVSTRGNLFYTLGCLSSQRCHVGGKRVVRGDLMICQYCCNSDYCNTEGCGIKTPPLTHRGPQCFDCYSVTSPEECRTVKTCDLDQQCATLERLQSKLPCDLCCHGDFCNDRCKHSTMPVIGSTVAPRNLVRCLQCDDMVHTSDCNLVTSCVPEDMCYVNQYVTSGGLVRYSAGCMPKQKCSTKRRFVLHGDDQRVIVCSECCHGNFCNIKGCGTAGLPLTGRGPICFTCREQGTQYACEHVTRCQIGEVCSLIRSTDNLWRSSCMTKRLCAAYTSIGKRHYVTSDHCAVCCSEDFCNESCNNSNATQTTTSPVGGHG